MSLLGLNLIEPVLHPIEFSHHPIVSLHFLIPLNLTLFVKQVVVHQQRFRFQLYLTEVVHFEVIIILKQIDLLHLMLIVNLI